MLFTPLALFLASALGAAALWLMMPNPALNLRKLGGLIGLATLGGLWLLIALRKPTWHILGISDAAFVYYYIFSAIAIIAAVRVITNQKPVYSALWFVMVVLASTGLFVVLSAEFMAFAMVIIYGGAILVTYMFVIMLASHAGYAEKPDELPLYDRFAREPLMGVVAGFLLLAVLLSVMFALENEDRNPQAKAEPDATIITTVLGDRPARDLASRLDELEGGATKPMAAEPERLTNVERIGLDLFRSHPLGLELAGVILLVALIGAVVIAKTQVPGEDEVRTAT